LNLGLGSWDLEFDKNSYYCKMNYDPIKSSLGKVFNRSPFLRKVFYRLLDILLLRTWHIKKDIRRWVKEIKDGVEILDAGSGFGQYSYFLSGLKIAKNITGIDVKEEQIKDCNEFFKKINRTHVLFKTGDLTSYRLKEQYDLILCVDVMEHILEDEKVFENYCFSMKKGAMLLISTPSDQGGSDVHYHEEGSFIGEHVRDGYNIKVIEEKLLRSGFSKVDARYVYGTPGKISWRLSMKIPILMLSLTKLFFIILPFYYLITFPFCLLLNYFDVAGKHKTGTGLVVKAWK
jgi:2-polyprenyl-3-methyl-5-hydroxy-6-metoxy-1,4-benzoquinol methylase